MTLRDKLTQWAADLEELAAEKTRAEGRHEQAMKGLADLGISSMEDGARKLEELKLELKQAEEKAENLIIDLEVKYAEHIEV